MNISRVISTVARRSTSLAVLKSGSVKLSQRGFAVSASQQIVNQQQNINDSSFRMHSVLAAAAAAAGVTMMGNDNRQTADCCGIAGVVGATGDAR